MKSILGLLTTRCLYFLQVLRIYRWPAKINLQTLIEKTQLLTAQKSLIEVNRIRKKNELPQIEGNIGRSSRLKFHSLYSYNRVASVTPCVKSLVGDLASCTNLRGKKILALGSRNHVELEQLELYGAEEHLITAIDLYSNFQRITSMDFHDLKFPDESFDIIFWAGSFAYAEDPALAAKEARRVCKENGIVAVGDTLIGNATKDRLSATIRGRSLEKEVSRALEQAANEHTLLTYELSTIENLISFFKKTSDRIVLTRLYDPCHANFVMIKGQSEV